jgi:hypothetical protein
MALVRKKAQHNSSDLVNNTFSLGSLLSEHIFLLYCRFT